MIKEARLLEAGKEENEDDFEFDNKEELMKYINALCANIEDKKIAKEIRKKLLYKLRNEHGAIV